MSAMMRALTSLHGLVADANEACRRRDLATLSRLMRSLVPELPHALAAALAGSLEATAVTA